MIDTSSGRDVYYQVSIYTKDLEAVPFVVHFDDPPEVDTRGDFVRIAGRLNSFESEFMVNKAMLVAVSADEQEKLPRRMGDAKLDERLDAA